VGVGGYATGGMVAGGGPGSGGGFPTGGIGSGGVLPGSGGVTTGGNGGDGGVATGGTAGAGGGGPGTCCPDGQCICRGPDPTEASAGTKGPYTTAQYTSGFPTGTRFRAATIYHPTGDAAPPFGGVVICPGFTAVQSSIAGWGPFLASHGIIVMTIDTTTTNDSVVQRSEGLLQALDSLKKENERSGSPLSGKLDPARWGLMGWSMGGGGTWIDAAKHPELKVAISLAGHNATAGGASVATGTTVPSMQFCGATDTAILGGGGQSQGVYDIIPASTPKILYEMAGEGHFSWGTPTTNGNNLGRYGLAWLKYWLEGDQRYKPILLKEGPNASMWKSNFM
jgi:dienelactone hydrolase